MQKYNKNLEKIGFQKNIRKITPKINFGSHFGLLNPSKIEEKTYKNEVKKRTRKKCEKSGNMTPTKKPVLARNGKSEKV